MTPLYHLEMTLPGGYPGAVRSGETLRLERERAFAARRAARRRVLAQGEVEDRGLAALEFAQCEYGSRLIVVHRRVRRQPNLAAD